MIGTQSEFSCAPLTLMGRSRHGLPALDVRQYLGVLLKRVVLEKLFHHMRMIYQKGPMTHTG